MRASYGGNDPEAVAAWHRLQALAESADLLVLDDVGAEGKGDDLRAELLRIVDARQNAGLPILATSNYGTDTISQPAPAGCGMDLRLASRFGRLRPVLMGTTDFRRMR
jgi:DNA replication protein DnaC